MSSIDLIRQAWGVLWQRKALILAGVIMAAAGGATGGLADLARRVLDPAPSTLAAISAGVLDAVPVETIRAATPPDMQTALLIASILLGLLLLAALIGLIAAGLAWVFALSWLITGAAAPTGEHNIIRAALSISVRRLWHLLLVVSIPPLPVLLAAILSLAGTGGYLGAVTEPGDWRAMLTALTGARWLWIAVGVVNGLALLVTLYLLILQTFALRACVLEDATPRAAYRRGRAIMHAHIPQAASLLALQAGVQIGLTLLLTALLLAIPAVCIIRPLAVMLNGLIRAFFAILWTLAWGGWTRSGTPPFALEPR